MAQIGHRLVGLLLLAAMLGVAGCQGASSGKERDADQVRVQMAALTEAEQAMAAAEKRFGGNHPQTAMAMAKLGALYKQHGRFNEAVPLFKQVVAIQEQVAGANAPETATALHNLGILYREFSMLAEAEPLLQRALQIREKALGANHSDTAQSLHDLARLFRAQGRFAEAEPLMLRVLQLQEQEFGAEHPKTAAALFNLAMLYRGERQHDKAQPLLERVVRIREKSLGPDHVETAKALNKLGALYVYQKRFHEAEPLIRRALAIHERRLGPDHPETANDLNELASLYRSQVRKKMGLSTGGHQDRRNEAETLYQRALSIQERVLGQDHPETAKTLHNLANLYTRTGDLDKAFAMRRQGFRATNSFLERVMWGTGEKTRQAYLNAQEESINTYLTLLNALDNEEAAREAANYSLTRKGMLLRIASEIHAVAQSGHDPELRVQAETLAMRKRELAQRLFGDSEDGARIGELNKEIYELETALGRKVQALGRAKNVVEPEALVTALRPGEVLVDFLVFHERELRGRDYKERQLIAVVTDPQAKPAVRIVKIGGMDAISSKVKAYREAMEQENAANTTMSSLAKEVHRLIWTPLQPLLAGKETVYLVPDGALHLLPFKAMMDDQGRYLGQTTHLVTLSSARDLVVPPLQGQAAEPVIVAGPDYYAGLQARDRSGTRGTRTSGMRLSEIHFGLLPGALQEGRTLSEQMRQNNAKPVLVTEAAATEGMVSAIHGPRILHLATHGFFLDTQVKPVALDAEGGHGENRGFAVSAVQDMGEESTSGEGGLIAMDPMSRSGLALAGANSGVKGGKAADGTDGVLTAGEAVNLDLEGTDLVVLSACQTGVGDVRNGEGVYGLQRAFQEAGAKALLTTLWSISDEGTMAFMQAFYGRFLKGIPPQQALQQTQDEFIKSAQWSHPYYWAPFVMVGMDYRPTRAETK